MRIDPAVVNGTHRRRETRWAAHAGPDLSVEGTIAIERLADVLYVGRSVHCNPIPPSAYFRLLDGGTEAERVPVALGRAFVNTIEILKGLQVSDHLTLSDMFAYDNDYHAELK
jgi:HlyD family secretion protein